MSFLVSAYGREIIISANMTTAHIAVINPLKIIRAVYTALTSGAGPDGLPAGIQTIVLPYVTNDTREWVTAQRNTLLGYGQNLAMFASMPLYYEPIKPESIHALTDGI